MAVRGTEKSMGLEHRYQDETQEQAEIGEVSRAPSARNLAGLLRVKKIKMVYPLCFLKPLKTFRAGYNMTRFAF